MPFTPKGSQQASPGQSESGSIWDPRGDVDDDGDVDLTDRTLYMSKDNNWPPQSSSTVVAQAFSDVGNPFMFQGRPHFAIDTAASDTSGKLMLNDHRARFNDPVTGRWVTRDPVGTSPMMLPGPIDGVYLAKTPGQQSCDVSIRRYAPIRLRQQYANGMNLYQYIQSKPISLHDPSGYSDNYYEPECFCWAAEEFSNLCWLDALPDCPCFLLGAQGGGWTEPVSEPWFHDGAANCVRSTPPMPDGSGQQCCYDDNDQYGYGGKLITGGSGAGSPDKTSPEESRWRHFVDDVNPWFSVSRIL